MQREDRIENFRQRILKNNPYQLNRYGDLEIPGLPSIPVAGLTAMEATSRLSADPDLRDFIVKVTLLRLKDVGEAALKPFGYDLFEGEPSTFAPVSDIQVPLDYIVGPGDKLQIQLYGNEPASYSLTVERDGRINFPKLGPISVSGLTFENARAVIEQHVAKQLIGSRVSVTMGDLRSIRVFVLGEANKPGSYTVSGLSTMTNALFVSGGVKKIGSLRNIQLKRNGRLVTVLDLYDLLLHGDTSGDRQLLPGDVIFIPPIGPIVSVDGAVRRPAIYEVKGEKTVADAIELAGGLSPEADAKLVQMERILPSSLHEMQNVDLTSEASHKFLLANGDKLRIPLIRPTLENSVTLTGYVFRPGEFEYKPGLHLSDVLGSFDELRPDADRHYIMIRREVPPEEKLEVVSADLTRALAHRHGASDPELRPRDKIFVFDLSASRERIIAPIIRDLGLQATPEQPAQAGEYRRQGQVAWPVPAAARNARLGSHPSRRQFGGCRLRRPGGAHSLRGDQRRCAPDRPDRDRPRRDPAWRHDRRRRAETVRRFGHQAHSDVGATRIDRAHGRSTLPRQVSDSSRRDAEIRAGTRRWLHQYCALPKARFIFEKSSSSARRICSNLLVNRMQSDLACVDARINFLEYRNLERQCRQRRVDEHRGRSTTDYAAARGKTGWTPRNQSRSCLKSAPGSADDVELRNGDQLLIPKRNQEVTILGEVQSPTSHVFQTGLTRDDYIAKSGGVTQKADKKRIYVVRVNGDVFSGERSGWFRRSQSVEIHPGDTIVVPLDTERVRALPMWQAITTIIYNLAVALLAIRSV